MKARHRYPPFLSLSSLSSRAIARSHDTQYLSRVRYDLRTGRNDISRRWIFGQKNVVFPRFLSIVPEARSLRLWSRPKNDGSINLAQFMLKALNRTEIITRLIFFFSFFFFFFS